MQNVYHVEPNSKLMKVHENEILIIYNPDSSSDRKTVAHAQAVSKHVRSLAFDRSPATSTQFRGIINMLGVHPREMLNKADPYYQENIRGREFDDEDWLNVLIRNPRLLRSAIAVKGKKAIICDNPTDIYKL